MNKLEVGMYVRFNYHRVTVPIQISKIKEKHYEDIERYYYYLTDNGLVISEAQILKASFNIIDLIEVGDYVNGYKVSRITGTRWDDNDLHCYCDYCQDQETLKWIMIAEKDIKTVVTKEQFESMSYRIGDDK